MAPYGDETLDVTKLVGLTDQDFRAPDLIGTVEGWRAWVVQAEAPAFGVAPRLESATYNYYWAPRQKARAHCEKCGADVPGESCSCGFYSAKTLEHLRTMGYHTYDPAYGSICVVGRLANWGKVIEGTQGWRAEYAYPVTLYVPFEGWRLAKPLAKAYGCDVELLNLLDRSKKPGDGKAVQA